MDGYIEKLDLLNERYDGIQESYDKLAQVENDFEKFRREFDGEEPIRYYREKFHWVIFNYLEVLLKFEKKLYSEKGKEEYYNLKKNYAIFFHNYRRGIIKLSIECVFEMLQFLNRLYDIIATEMKQLVTEVDEIKKNLDEYKNINCIKK